MSVPSYPGTEDEPRNYRVFVAQDDDLIVRVDPVGLVVGSSVVVATLNPLTFVAGSSAGTVADTTIAAKVITSAYIPVVSDAGLVLEVNSSSVVNITIPPHTTAAFPVGSVFDILRYGTGAVNLIGGTGVSIRTPSTLSLRAQYSTVSLRQRAFNEWVLAGDVA
jgi:hypothetical protein